MTFVNDDATIRAVQNVTDAVYETIKHIPNLNYVFIYTPQPQVTNSYSAAAGGNMLGLAGTTVDRVGKSRPRFSPLCTSRTAADRWRRACA